MNTRLPELEIGGSPRRRSARFSLLVPALLLLASLAIPGPSFADIVVPPIACRCEGLDVDGVIGPVEYANGVKGPLQDFVTGTHNGELFLVLENEILFIGLRLPKTALGELSLYFDSVRFDTLDGVPWAQVPQGEDRRLWVEYAIDSQPYMSEPVQSYGQNGLWVDVMNPADLWDIKVGFGKPANDPDFVHIELRVDTRPASTSFNEPMASQKIGLGIEHLAGGGAVQILPNDPANAPVDTRTLTWETLLFEFPEVVPLSVASWNVGQMPAILPIGDGGAGEPGDFASFLFEKDVLCVNEVWDDADGEDLRDKINDLRANIGLGPMIAVGLGSDDDGTQTTGLMMMSARPLLTYDVHEYNPNHCAGTDCLQDKGVIWARVLIDGGAPTLTRDGTEPGDADHFIDVYCTHLQSGDAEFSMRGLQIDELATYISQTRAKDRPAILMGDFNVVGSQPGLPSSEYTSLLAKLDVDTLTPFDAANQWLSDLYDLGTLPQLANSVAPLRGTSIQDGACTTSILADLLGGRRLDYIFALPAPDLWPGWGIGQTPSFVADPGFVLAVSTSECLSDHALVQADLDLIKTELPGKWNPTKDHLMTFRTLELHDHGSGGCCADWFTKEISIDSTQTDFSDEATPDGDFVHPGWFVSRTLTAADQVNLKLEVWEADWPSSDDVYDSSDHGKHARFRFDHFTGLWEESDSTATPIIPIGSFNDFPDGMIWTTQGDSSDDFATVVHALEGAEQ